MRILTLDGGGAKGFYTLGVLQEMEQAAGKPLCEVFQLIYGTSTGSIIASLLALGKSVDEILALYRSKVVEIVGAKSAKARSRALSKLADEIYGGQSFDTFKTGIGITAVKWLDEEPIVFKNEPSRAATRSASFVPGFGCSISDAVQASCSAFPFFEKKTITKGDGTKIEAIDGGFCANNPTLYAIADALGTMKVARSEISLINVGVGHYPAPGKGFIKKIISNFVLVKLLEKTLDTNTSSMSHLMSILFGDLDYIRLSDTFSEPSMAADLFETDLEKLGRLTEKGKATFGYNESSVRKLMGV